MNSKAWIQLYFLPYGLRKVAVSYNKGVSEGVWEGRWEHTQSWLTIGYRWSVLTSCVQKIIKLYPIILIRNRRRSRNRGENGSFFLKRGTKRKVHCSRLYMPFVLKPASQKCSLILSPLSVIHGLLPERRLTVTFCILEGRLSRGCVPDPGTWYNICRLCHV